MERAGRATRAGRAGEDHAIPAGPGGLAPRNQAAEARGHPASSAQRRSTGPAIREPSSLSTFVRDVGRVEVLDAKGEQRLARVIESREIEMWAHIFSFAPGMPLVLGVIRAVAGDQAPDLRALQRTAAATVAGRRKGQGGLPGKAVHRAARALRELDRDRHVLDALLAAVERVEHGAHEHGHHGAREHGHGAHEHDAHALPRGATGESFAAWAGRARALAGEAAQARNAFTEANLRLVFMVASQYAGFGVPLPDLVQEGSLGLMTAVDRFDYHRGLRFSTYAVWWIRHMVRRAVANKSRMVRVPVYLLESKQRVDRVRHELSAQLGRTPSDEEIAEAAGVSSTRVETVRALGAGIELSLDQGVGEDADQPRLDTFRDPRGEERSPTQELSLRDQVAHLESVFHTLTPQEADILRKRFALDEDHEWTLREIAQRYGVSRERIRQLQNRALGKLRKALDDLEAPVAA